MSADGENEVDISPTTSMLGGDAPTSATTVEADPHAVSVFEALSYYAGLPSKPRLIYRTGKAWVPPTGRRQIKELRPVFNHPILDLWHDGLASQVVAVMDKHEIKFTSIDVVRFLTVGGVGALAEEEDAGEDVIGPVTLWVGVHIDHTPPSLAYEAAQDVLVLLAEHGLTDIDVDFRGSVVTRLVGPRLYSPVHELDPIVKFVRPLTPALGLPISTMARLGAQGTMALYLSNGHGKLLGLSCRHVLLGSNEGSHDYEYHPHAPIKNVVHLGKRAFDNLVESIKFDIAERGFAIGRWRDQIARSLELDASAAAKAAAERAKEDILVQDAAVTALGALLEDLKSHWTRPEDRVLGPILCSPVIRHCVGAEQFTEDWGVFGLDRDKLGDGFNGNKVDLGTKLLPSQFTRMCFPTNDANWRFRYPLDRLLPLQGTLSLELMRRPDMWGSNRDPCLLVVKCGGATGTTIGRANGIMSPVRNYFGDMTTIPETSMEWAIFNYDNKSDVFSAAGDSGSIIADIRGRIGGILTQGAAGMTDWSDITYATPFYWILERIKENGFADANLNVA